MKRKHALKTKLLCLCLGSLFACSMALSACGKIDPDKVPYKDPEKPPVVDPNPPKPVDPDPPNPEEPSTVSYREGYEPTKFNKTVTNEITKLTDGAHVVANSVTLKNGHVAVVYAVEVDLSKVDVVAGTKDNKSSDFTFQKAVPYAHAQAWEKATGGHVYASINADFFGAQCVNAFVKDGVIVKTGHNDNGNYDYKNGASDVPASAPMLFGVKGDIAQIAPIVNYEGDVTTPAVKEKLVKSTLSYQFVAQGKEGGVAISMNVAPSRTAVAFNTTRTTTISNGVVLKVDTTGGYSDMKVLEKSVVTSSTKFSPETGVGYVIANKTNATGFATLNAVEKDGIVSVAVKSEDGLWNGYTTILGCRQALVLDDEIPATVKLENTNGAQATDIPRSAVGIKPNGNVVIFGVEAMRYYGFSEAESDSYGLNLPELAEFIYYYGCTQAANFDGGGSTQIVTRADDETEGKVILRSADKLKKLENGTFVTCSKQECNITNADRLHTAATRPVMNSLLVVSKKK